MEEKQYSTDLGCIHYWVSKPRDGGPTLVFLPGLTADHRLFDRQVAWFQGRYNLMVWDAPGHGASWPFSLTFSLLDKARWVDELLNAEGLREPILIGQSMGGYVGQAYAQLYPEKLRGFGAIDSAPLQRRYVTGVELWLLKRMEPVYRWYPWSWLLWAGTRGVAATEEGRSLMGKMMEVYQGDQERYARLAGHGFRILAQAMEADLPYRIPCPALLICGARDRAGSCKRYNKAWHRETGIPLHWIPGAGHNSNTDAPEVVNALLEELIHQAEQEE